jgi:hypothetical protein
MSLHLITTKIIHHPMCSFRFGVIIFGGAVGDILTGLLLFVCEDVPSEDHVWFEDRCMVASLCDE